MGITEQDVAKACRNVNESLDAIMRQLSSASSRVDITELAEGFNVLTKFSEKIRCNLYKVEE